MRHSSLQRAFCDVYNLISRITNEVRRTSCTGSSVLLRGGKPYVFPIVDRSVKAYLCALYFTVDRQNRNHNAGAVGVEAWKPSSFFLIKPGNPVKTASAIDQCICQLGKTKRRSALLPETVDIHFAQSSGYQAFLVSLRECHHGEHQAIGLISVLYRCKLGFLWQFHWFSRRSRSWNRRR